MKTIKTCKRCNREFESARSTAQFCSNTHRVDFHRMQKLQAESLSQPPPKGLIDELRAKTEEIMARPQNPKNSVPEVVVGARKVKPPLDPFFEDEVLITD